MPLNSFTPQQTQDPLLQRIQEDLRRTLDPIVKVLNALNPTISPGTTGIPAGTVQLQGLPAPGAKGGVATLDGSGLVPSAQIPDLSGTYQPLSGKDAASGYAGLTAGSLIKVAELTGLAPSFATVDLTTVAPGTPVKDRLYSNLIPRAWVNFKDVAGSITINKAVNCTVGFRTGTAVGDYQLILTTPCADGSWVAVGSGRATTQPLFVSANQSVILHNTTTWNFTTIDSGGTTLARPDIECMLVVFGN